MKLSGTTVSHGGRMSCRFTNIEVTNEEETAFEVKWHCPDQPPDVNVDGEIFKLMKIWGKEVLVTVSVQDPTGVSVYQRKSK
jgi:hypothetical protein